MATPLSASALVAALKREGVNVSERYGGWRTHNRNHVGSWGGVNGVLIHHTAGSSSLALCYNGRSDLPGPLCHSHLSKSGVATMTSAGRANHAGKVAANAHNAVVAESSTHPRPSASSGTVDGNRHYYGIEIENLGTGRDPYPTAQYDAAVRWAAAICRAHGWSAHSVVGHKETSIEGKIDPSFDMNAFRRDIAARLNGSADGGTSPTTPEEDDMPVRTSLGKSKDQTAKWSEWTIVKWDKEYADPKSSHADGYNPGYIPKSSSWADFGGRLVVTGMQSGDQLQVRYEVHDWKSGKSTGSPWTEIVADHQATPGDQFVSLPCSKGLTAGQHVYVSVKPIPGAGRESAPAPKVTSGRWTIRQDR